MGGIMHKTCASGRHDVGSLAVLLIGIGAVSFLAFSGF